MKTKDFIKYPSIPYVASRGNFRGRIYEKIDGSNCQIRVIDSRIIPGTRSKRVEQYQKPLQWMSTFQNLVLKNKSFLNLSESQILFCEFFESEGPRLYFIDLYDIEKRRFIDYEIAKEIVSQEITGLELLTSIDDKQEHSRNELEEIIMARYRCNPLFEGLVIKDYENQKFVKIIAEQIDKIVMSFINDDQIFPDQIKRRTVQFIIEKIKRETGRNVHESIVRQKLGELNV